ncbi:peptidoglycan-binding domain-containing protein [Streptomyces sp. NPDC000658]|uniref:peptidoglycan-binding domain-containing protein n=1 Tax=Streptomyces sp. NPDC000658 TaxID=3154266 RepID=UPI0033318E55
MRHNVLARTLVSLAAAAGLAATGLATASTSVAAAGPAAQPAAVSQSAAVKAVNNLGLNTERAKNWQCLLRDTGYSPGAIDGELGTNSWKAAQRKFNDMGFNAGTVDGDVGPNTIKALQRYLNFHDYNLVVDGKAGANTRAAFWDYNGLPFC